MSEAAARRAPITGTPSESLAQRLGRTLAERCDLTVQVVETDNAVRLISTVRERRRLTVRVSRALEPLGTDAIDALCDFALERPGARARVRTLFAALEPAPRQRRQRITTLDPRGAVHDLAALLEAESQRAFGAPAVSPVTFGPRRSVRRGQRSIRLGSYSVASGVIRIHRLLDDARVPGWFVGFVLYHELLHHRLGIDESGPRRKVHPRAFRDLERAHPRYEDAKRLERTLIPLLLGRRRARPEPG
ncbi:MAG: hypothetical protein H6744_04350 [Deltaproteobacteria bacterium]|nr:hypothetical protein [Deltaproteobacteria bacterium]MCB9785905.1 hypothetical protein [Deltaproteobacteria bacterium]